MQKMGVFVPSFEVKRIEYRGVLSDYGQRKGEFPLSRSFNFTCVNKIEAMYKGPRVLLRLRANLHTLPLFYLRA